MNSNTSSLLTSDNDEYPDRYAKEMNLEPISKVRSMGRFNAVNIVHAMLLALNVSLFWSQLHNHKSRAALSMNADNTDVFSAESAIHYTFQSIDTHDHRDPFSGKPRPTLDQAWSDLLRSSVIRISKDELESMNRSSIPLLDGSGYVGYLETYHMLHCVKRIYQFQYLDYYEEVRSTGELSLVHWEHCLQVLRKGIMCNAGPSVNTYIRDPVDLQRIKGDSTAPRRCADWSVFEDWASSRALSRGDVVDASLSID